MAEAGAYACDPAYAPYAQLAVTVSQSHADGSVAEAVVHDRMACTGGVEGWQEMLTAPHAAPSFCVGSASFDAAAWFAGNWADRSETQQWVSVS